MRCNLKGRLRTFTGIMEQAPLAIRVLPRALSLNVRSFFSFHGRRIAQAGNTDGETTRASAKTCIAFREIDIANHAQHRFRENSLRVPYPYRPSYADVYKSVAIEVVTLSLPQPSCYIVIGTTR